MKVESAEEYLKEISTYKTDLKYPTNDPILINILDKIIAIELSIFFTSNVPGGYGYTIDMLYELRSELIIELEEIFNVNYMYLNEEHI